LTANSIATSNTIIDQMFIITFCESTRVGDGEQLCGRKALVNIDIGSVNDFVRLRSSGGISSFNK
jgi:hypothetical protein